MFQIDEPYEVILCYIDRKCGTAKWGDLTQTSDKSVTKSTKL